MAGQEKEKRHSKVRQAPSSLGVAATGTMCPGVLPPLRRSDGDGHSVVREKGEGEEKRQARGRGEKKRRDKIMR